MGRENLAMYSEAYRSYDLSNRFLSLFTDSMIRKKAAEEALASGPRKILDIATGTGDTALELARLAYRRGVKAEIVAIDASPLMLSVAKRKSSGSKGAKPRFETGDASSLKYSGETFDCAVCTFALKNLELKSFAKESYRVLRKGGRLVIADISAPEGRLNALAFRIYLFYMRLFGLLSGKKLYRWLPGSTCSFDKKGFMELMAANGFRLARSRSFLFGIAYILCYTK
ncbi:MAG: class I SAM-dependent methyltransferase [Candidatus Micrarchaeaceae archaeon]